MANIFYDANYATTWTAIGAIAQGLAAGFAIAALFYSMTTFRKSLKTSHYTELDRLYFDILKLALEKPHLESSKPARDDEQNAQYEVYAWIVWNFLETVYDRCWDDKPQWPTWAATFEAASSLHREWFDRPDNHTKFKKEFQQFVRGGKYKCQ